ncbi:MAG: gamma-glutamylcyclotransferase family protein [Roseitalea porphyridii]|uniref:gamma-glutamylcyclotransferase family protein n=1 Tax=Roseitalea porphyridii TaxID=1852022 RepID=UPI0032ED8B88
MRKDNNGAPGHPRLSAGADEAVEPARSGAASGLVAYFGYGSLVNRATLRTGIVAAHRARLKGWRRTWRSRPDGGPSPARTASAGVTPSFLSAGRAADAAIDGLLIVDYAHNLAAVDAREFHYHRRRISLDDLEFAELSGIAGSGLHETHGPGSGIALYVYEGRTDLPHAPGPAPILRSYLDAVMQGFLREFGEAGLHRFVAETGAFHTPIHEDRDAPLYPRAVTLSADEADLFEAALATVARKGGN